MIIFGLFFGLVFLPVILSFLGPSEWHSHSNEYEIAPTEGRRKRQLDKRSDFSSNDREMVSFIQTTGDIESDEKMQKDIQ